MATSAALTRSNLYSQVFWNFFNLLDNRSNVIDPRNASGDRRFVYEAEPNLGRGFDGYPFVIVNQPNISRNALVMGDDLSAGVSGDFIVEVRSSKSMAVDKTADEEFGKGLQWLNEISDDVLGTLNSASNRSTLRGNNIGFVEVESQSTEKIPINNESVYVREIRVSFDTRLLTVSA